VIVYVFVQIVTLRKPINCTVIVMASAARQIDGLESAASGLLRHFVPRNEGASELLNRFHYRATRIIHATDW
jgi:hypothetical protein